MAVCCKNYRQWLNLMKKFASGEQYE